jgi:hypothetical protein
VAASPALAWPGRRHPVIGRRGASCRAPRQANVNVRGSSPRSHDASGERACRTSHSTSPSAAEKTGPPIHAPSTAPAWLPPMNGRCPAGSCASATTTTLLRRGAGDPPHGGGHVVVHLGAMPMPERPPGGDRLQGLCREPRGLGLATCRQLAVWRALPLLQQEPRPPRTGRDAGDKAVESSARSGGSRSGDAGGRVRSSC